MISMSGKSRMSIFPGTQRLFMKITDGMDGMIGWGLKLLKKIKTDPLINYLLTSSPPVSEGDSSGFLRSHGQYFISVSCRFLLPTTFAIRSTGHPRQPDG